jgi:hypothetical protein
MQPDGSALSLTKDECVSSRSPDWRVSTIHYYGLCPGCGYRWGRGITFDVRPVELAGAERTEWCDHCQPRRVFPPVVLVAELWEPDR